MHTNNYVDSILRIHAWYFTIYISESKPLAAIEEEEEPEAEPLIEEEEEYLPEIETKVNVKVCRHFQIIVWAH